jgi:glycyl-tRNA synthetase
LLRGDGPLFHDRTLAEATFPNGAHLAATNAGITVRGKDGKVQFQALLTCPNCGKPMEAERAKASAFNLMFRTNIGPGGGRAGYMRPETAQGMFMAFSWLYRQNRDQLPFGAVQLGKAYRNEISPRQGFLRLREFHQMEAEVFFDPRSKTWPGWASARSRVLPLLARDTSEVVRLSVGDAVDRKIIANEALGFFLALTHEFLTAAGLPDGILRFRQHLASEMAHYSSDTWDAEFFSPRFGWVEIVGIADRTDFDLKSHEGVSGVELRGFRRFDEPREEERLRVVPDPAKLGPKFKGRAGPVLEAMKALRPASESIERVEIAVDGERVELGCEYFRVERVRETITGESFVPHVVEPSFGVDRILYALFESAYEEGRREWPVLHLAPSVAPAKVGVFPLMERDELDVRAQEIDADLRIRGVASYYDGTQSVGKRYARADEAGIPWCITVDYQTKEDGTVTVRDRETAEQIRVAAASVVDWIRERSAPRLARHR